MPPFVTVLADIAGRFFSEEVRAKMVYLGTDYFEELKKIIDPSQIPKIYGGTCEHDIDKFPSLINSRF